MRVLMLRGRKLTGITSNGILGVQLVGHIRVVLPSTALTNGRLHETREGRKDVDRRAHTLVFQLTVNEDLTLCNVTSQVGNGVSDIYNCQQKEKEKIRMWLQTIVRHGQNRNLGDGAVTSLDTPSTFVHGRQVSIHITGVTTTTGDFFPCGRDLTKSITVGGQVSHDDQNVLLQLISVVFGSRQSKTRGDDTLNSMLPLVVSSKDALWIHQNVRRVIGQVQEQSDTLHTTILLEVASEEPASFHVDTHGSENDREVLLVTIVDALCRLLDQTCLTTDLRGDFVVWKTSGGEDGDLLSSSNGVHGIDGGNTGRDHFFGVDLFPRNTPNKQPLLEQYRRYTYSRVRVNRLTVDIQVILRQHLGTLVNRPTRTVKDTSQHVLGHTQLQAVAGELDFGLDAWVSQLQTKTTR